MRARIGNDLVLINLWIAVLLLTILFFPSNGLRIVLGVPSVLFFPGYTLVAALYPRGQAIDGVQRAALSLGLSIAVVPLIGLILNYTSWGITLESVLYSNVAFIFTMSVVAWARRKRFPVEERHDIDLHWRMPAWRGSAWDKALTLVLAVSVVGAAVAVGYVIGMPKSGERFTEFYVLGVDGKTEGYPQELAVGQSEGVTVGIVNREYEEVNYRLVITVDGIQTGDTIAAALTHEEEWTQEVMITPQMVGNGQKVEFSLYRDGVDEPYLEPLRLWIDVTQ